MLAKKINNKSIEQVHRIKIENREKFYNKLLHQENDYFKSTGDQYEELIYHFHRDLKHI